MRSKTNRSLHIQPLDMTMDYQDTLNYIYSLTNFEVTPAGTYSSKTFNLDRMDRLLASLGNPEAKFRSVHIAGSKGKGSTAVLIESVLRSAGYRTALYTSPHLHTFRERIQMSGHMISRDDVVKGITKQRPVADQTPNVTTFEMMTALAFDHFAENQTEIAVVEVGLGGRLDATNVLLPLLSVITPISYEHTAILGNTLSEIATEKAGIIKPNVPAVLSPQNDQALSTIEKIARERHAPLTEISPDLRFHTERGECRILPITESMESQTFIFERSSAGKSSLECKTSLVGRHQLMNAASALAAITLIEQQFPAPDQAIAQGIARASWKGRFEVLQRSPYVVIDGAHNAASMHELMATIRRILPQAKIHLVFGSLKDKDINGMFSEFNPYVSSLTLTRSHNPRALDPEKLAELAQSFGMNASTARDIGSAISNAMLQATENDIICITGSLFTAAEARETWLGQQGIHVEKDT